MGGPLSSLSGGRSAGYHCADRVLDEREDRELIPDEFLEDAVRGTPHMPAARPHEPSSSPLATILAALEDAKAEEIVDIDLAGKSSFADVMVIASGRSERHVGAVAENVVRALKDAGFGRVPVEGLDSRDWVLIDAGSVIVHVFRPEVRSFYNLEKMWASELPRERSAV
jgi:ribosome-associated protein